MRRVDCHQLWVGTVVDAWDLRTVLSQGIQAIVDLASNEAPIQLTRDVIYCRFPLLDGAGNSAASLRLAINSISALLQAGIPTFVYCSAGMSRTPVIVAGALSEVSKRPFMECLAEMTVGHPHDVAAGLVHDVRKVIDEQIEETNPPPA